MEEALYDSVAMRGFAGIDLGQEGAPDETTVCKFRHLLERHKLGEKLLLTVNGYLARNGIKISNGTIVDATVISAPSSTKNEDGQRDPQMNQTANGKQWYFGMTAHVGVDSRTKLVDPVPASAANVADFQALPHRLRGQTDASRSVAACARDYTNRLHRFGQRTGERVKASRRRSSPCPGHVPTSSTASG